MERGREIPFTDSFSDISISQGYARAEAEHWESVRSGWQEPNYMTDHLLFLRICINKKLDVEPEPGIGLRYLDMGQKHVNGDLNQQKKYSTLYYL